MARYIDADVLWKRTTTKFDDCEEFLDLIETQPTAELPIKEKCCVCPHCDNCDVNEDGIIERKKGEWIFNPSDAIEMMFTKPKCSECGFESADGGNFCSNCGADMRGEEDGEIR